MEKKRFYYCESCQKKFEVLEETIKEQGLQCSLKKCSKTYLIYLGNENSSEDFKNKRYEEFVTNKKEDYEINLELEDDSSSAFSSKGFKRPKVPYSAIGE